MDESVPAKLGTSARRIADTIWGQRARAVSPSLRLPPWDTKPDPNRFDIRLLPTARVIR
jgi:hypothetical protein